MTEAENYVRLVRYFSQYSEYSADRIEEVVHAIMDNPELYPEYFNWWLNVRLKHISLLFVRRKI